MKWVAGSILCRACVLAMGCGEIGKIVGASEVTEAEYSMVKPA